jgi:hypothetical protein
MEKGEAFTFGLGFLNPYPSLEIVRKEISMLRLFKKKNDVVKNWHSRAMLINPHKTRIIIINS